VGQGGRFQWERKGGGESCRDDPGGRTSYTSRGESERFTGEPCGVKVKIRRGGGEGISYGYKEKRRRKKREMRELEATPGRWNSI